MTTPRNALNWVRDGINKIIASGDAEWADEELYELYDDAQLMKDIYDELIINKRG